MTSQFSSNVDYEILWWISMYFGIGKLAYSFIERHNVRFIVIEVLGTVLTFLVWYWLLDPLMNLFFYIFGQPFFETFTLAMTAVGIIYFSTGFLSRILDPRNPIESRFVKKKKPEIRLGIIDITWLIILGAFYTGTSVIRHFPSISNEILVGQSDTYYQLMFDQIQFFLDLSIDMIIAIGTITGVCMTILWAGEIWRDSKAKTYRGHIISSAKMVVAFFFIGVGLFGFIILPLVRKVAILNEMMVK